MKKLGKHHIWYIVLDSIGLYNKRFFTYRLSVGVARRCNVSVALANNGRVLASTNGVHVPMSVVVVNDMDVPITAPWHSLYQSLAKMVESNCNLHLLVLRVAIACTKKHHLKQDVRLASKS